MRNKKFLLSAVVVAVIFLAASCYQPVDTTEGVLPHLETIITGGSFEVLEGMAAGYSLDAYPQVKSISSMEWVSLEEVPETGLYLVDTNYVPYNLDELLYDSGVVLNPDGTLVNKEGELATLFMLNQTVKVASDEASAVRGDPYPFDYYSWSMRWRYDGGFCRDYYAYTDAYAWGPELGGGRPRTRIEYIYTYARISGHDTDSDYCYNCDQEHSTAHWDIGCFWPAFGTPCGYHYAYWRDGNVTGVHSWSWCD